MKMKFSKKLSSFILCIMLIVAMALTVTGCNGSKDESADSEVKKEETQTKQDAGTEDSAEAEGQVLGTGDTEFAVTVIDQEGNETEFEIHTDKETVGEALVETGLIEGEEGEYGLYVKTVNGITADYDADGVYWAFYVNGEYAQTGVDATPITEGEEYSFKVE